MICGKCFSKKENVLTNQSYQLSNAVLTVHHIPATQCNCRVYVSNSVNQEIKEYIDDQATLSGQVHISFSVV